VKLHQHAGPLATPSSSVSRSVSLAARLGMVPLGAPPPAQPIGEVMGRRAMCAATGKRLVGPMIAVAFMARPTLQPSHGPATNRSLAVLLRRRRPAVDPDVGAGDRLLGGDLGAAAHRGRAA
jgi:hypothetical protein